MATATPKLTAPARQARGRLAAMCRWRGCGHPVVRAARAEFEAERDVARLAHALPAGVRDRVAEALDARAVTR